MSSSPSDGTTALPAEPRGLTAGSREFGGGPVADAFEIRQRRWVKRLLPQTMFGRSLLLIVMPLVLVQMIAPGLHDRHWETVSYRLADVAGESRW
jgi:hypothetical protein